MKVLIAILFTVPLFAFGQYAENIRTGRPGQAIGAYTLGKSVVQIQSGYNYNKLEYSNSDVKINSLNTVVRLGLTERFEISGILNYFDESSEGLSYYQPYLPFSYENNGIDNLAFGARVNLSKNEGWLPAIGLQSRVILKFYDEPILSDGFGLANILATTNKINEKFSLTTNWLLIYSGDREDLVGRYVGNLSYSITDKVGVFAEIYANLLEPESTSYDGGFSYLVNNDLQLDLSAGIQNDDFYAGYFIDFGFSWRTDWRK
jgi:hypothetical protein